MLLFLSQTHGDSSGAEAGLGRCGDSETLSWVSGAEDLPARPEGCRHHTGLHQRMDGPQTLQKGKAASLIVCHFVEVFLTMQVMRLIMSPSYRWWRSTRLWFCRSTLELGWCAGDFKRCDGSSSTFSFPTESSSCARKWKSRYDQTT